MSRSQKTSKILTFLLFIFISFSCQEVQAVKAIIFDCDGVLVDTESLKFEAWQQALKEEGIDFLLEDYLRFVGHTPKYIVERIKSEKNVDFNTAEFLNRKNEVYKRSKQQIGGVKPIPLVVGFLKKLIEMKQNLGIKLGLASSARRAEIFENLESIGVLGSFDIIVSGLDDLKDIKDPEGTNKPKPYIYQRCAQLLDVAPEDCLVVEDTNAGVEAAAKAGCIAYAFPNKFASSFPLATKVIDPFTFEELSAQSFQPLLDLHK
jgi:beta-phosphoglucomutase-like phosphatase (HAD superfamily)